MALTEKDIDELMKKSEASFSPESISLRGLKVEADTVKEKAKEYINGKKYRTKAKEEAECIYKECDEVIEWGSKKVKQLKKMTKDEKEQLYKDIDTQSKRLKKLSKSIKV